MRPHLSHEEVDGYWRGTLAPAAVRDLEQHALGCGACLDELARVEELRAGLSSPAPATGRGRLAWPTAAALAVLAAGLLVDNARLRRAAPEPAPAVARIELEPAKRSSRIPERRVPPGAAHVLLSVDASEAAPPGSAFAASLLGPDGAPLLRLHGLRSGEDGAVAFFVPAGVLAGEHVLELRGGREPLEVWFRVTR